MNGFYCVAAGTVLYVISDIILKIFFPVSDPYSLSLYRFAPGLALLFFCQFKNMISWRSVFFALANVVNSIFGVIALHSGTLLGYTLAGQMRPLLYTLISIVILREVLSRSGYAFVALGSCVSLALVFDETGIFNFYTSLFLATTSIQCLSFVLLGQSSSKDVVGGLALYNLVGFTVAAFLSLSSGQDVLQISSNAILLAYGVPAFLGSILIAFSFKFGQVSKSSAANFLRLPLGLVASYFLIGEQVTLELLIYSALLLICIFGITNDGRAIFIYSWSVRISNAFQHIPRTVGVGPSKEKIFGSVYKKRAAAFFICFFLLALPAQKNGSRHADRFSRL